MNPLAHRIVAVLDANNQGEVNFREFVRALSVFSEGATAEAKIKCSSPAQRCPAWAVARDSHVALPTSAVAFGIYDVDGDGFISEADLLEVLQALIGSNMDEARLKVCGGCPAPVGLVVLVSHLCSSYNALVLFLFLSSAWHTRQSPMPTRQERAS